MIPKPPSCRGCPLDSPLGFIPFSGGGTNGVLLVGEAGGEQEAKQGRGFVGAAGQHLNILLRRARLERDPFGIANVLSCRPPGNVLSGAPYEHGAIQHCRPNLDQAIEMLRPRVILALGNTALRRLTGESGILRWRGFVLDGPQQCFIIPTIHPSFLLPHRGKEGEKAIRNPTRYTLSVLHDLRMAVRIATEGFSRLPTTYLKNPHPDRFEDVIGEYEQSGATWLAWDLETAYKLRTRDEEKFKELDSLIIRISFAFRPGYAVSVPWDFRYLSGIRRLLEMPRRSCTWNGYTFDEPLVRQEGIQLRGELHDTMWMWHLLHPDLDRGLESATSYWAPDIRPWKHLAHVDEALYSCIDADALLRVTLGVEERLKER